MHNNEFEIYSEEELDSIPDYSEKIRNRAEKRKMTLRHKASFKKVAKKTKTHGDSSFSVRKNKNDKTKEIEHQSLKRARHTAKLQLSKLNLANPEYDSLYNKFESYEKQAMPSHMLG